MDVLAVLSQLRGFVGFGDAKAPGLVHRHVHRLEVGDEAARVVTTNLKVGGRSDGKIAGHQRHIHNGPRRSHVLSDGIIQQARQSQK